MPAELVARSAFSLLHGASHPEELVEQAHAVGLSALAITDRDGVYGLPAAHDVAKRLGFPLLCGATVTVEHLGHVVLLAETEAGWARLCRLLSDAHANHPKGRARSTLTAVLEAAGGLTCIMPDDVATPDADALRQAYGDALAVRLARYDAPDDPARIARAVALARAVNAPLVATSDVLFHDAQRGQLADVLTAIRRRTPLAHLGTARLPNRARVLRGPAALEARFRDHPEAVRQTDILAERCTFRLDRLTYRYPREVVPDGQTPMGWLTHLAEAGLARRMPGGAPEAVRTQLAHELAVVEQLDFPSYFLTVADIVGEARRRGILAQGRGSAANSALCWALGVTEVDPSRARLVFERFLSPERGEPPDIDVDFEHERREEILQYVYDRYGRDRAAMVAEVITWRGRSAVRDVGRALELPIDVLDRLASAQGRWRAAPPEERASRLQEAGLDPNNPALQQVLRLADQLIGLPRHIGIHSGGFVISDTPLVELVPVEPASMPGRTVVQWDKYGVEGLRFVKVDLLALGMLTAIRKALDLISQQQGRRWTLADIPAEDPAVYAMFQAADTMGVFQIESRAQQAMLPRLRPRCFYDLVVEVALVRPGPIQGGMVHPYLRRRLGQEPVTYPHPALVPILERTLGVPLFQEQVMEIAVAVGGFSAGEADGLRRAMGAWRKRGGLDVWGERLKAGMAKRGIAPDFAEAIYQQILGFGEYGFPESHASSFALLVYASGWLKRHTPAAFCAALLDSQPMGFYAPRALVADAQRHGVEVLAVDVLHSDWTCSLEPRDDGPPALRLGLSQVVGMTEDEGRAIVAVVRDAPPTSIAALAARANVRPSTLTRLAEADALRSFKTHRRDAVYAVEGLWTGLPLFAGLERQEPAPDLAPLDAAGALLADYRTVGLSLHDHAARLARERLMQAGVAVCTVASLAQAADRDVVVLTGLVASRQKPGTAAGLIFLGLEDETGQANVVVFPEVWAAQRALLSSARLLAVRGIVQASGEVRSVRLLTAWRPEDVREPVSRSRDFH
ncbi:MAG: Error-prone polymerase [Pseudomonadota bacterium]|jgi:error-prone DNA polymerase